LGSAAAKWALLSHINESIRPSDYFTFLDGDDTYTNEHVLWNIYNFALLPVRPHFAWGVQSGKFSEQCHDISTADQEAVKSGLKGVRDIRWSFCHPRFFRGYLLQHMSEEHFKRSDGQWMQKATDRPLIYSAMELGGLENAFFLDKNAPHVQYSFTKRNGLLRFPSNETSEDKAYMVTGKPRRKLTDDIHVFCAVYRRKNTATFFQHLAASELPKNTILHVHVANNDPSRQEELQALATAESSSLVMFHVTNMLANHGGMARFILAHRCMKDFSIGFAVFIDDDQYVWPDSIANLWDQKAPQSMVSYFGKSWESPRLTYWQPSFGFPEISAGLNNTHTWHYAGTGMSIVDALIFSDERVFQVPKKYYFVEDLWLSYLLRVNGWRLKRALLEIDWDTDLSNGGQYNKLKTTKNEMFETLKRCPVPLITRGQFRMVQLEIQNTRT